MKKLTKEELLNKFRLVHGDKYDYSKVEYVNMNTKITIICPEHGEFTQYPSNHVKGIGCPTCGGNKRLTSEEYVSILKKRYKDTDILFDKVVYVNNHTPITLVCPEHGEFKRLPASLNENLECPECQKKRMSEKFCKTTERFVSEAREVHGDKYLYVNTSYTDHNQKVTITCPIHGDFQQIPTNHLKGAGCPKCGSKTMWENRQDKVDTEIWVQRAIEIHSDKYDYSESEYTGGHEKVKIICPKHGPFWQDAFAHVHGQGCPQCKSELSRSKDEEEICEFIRSALPGEKVEMGNRRILYLMELDIYIPERRIAIEYDGLYWHNEIKQPSKKYHLNKTKKCSENGIRLIHIFEDEWTGKKEQVKSRLKSILGLYDRKLSASKCKVCEIDSKTMSAFLNENHLQGSCNAKFRYGLFFDNELVSVMSFGKTRKNLHGKGGSDDYELLRFCNKLNTTVTGGAERLLSHFVKDHAPKSIISYADLRWSDGNLYKKLGFTHTHNSAPSYFYIINNKRENRYKYRKDVLIKEGYNPLKSEHSIMLERGIYRIYDCGCMVYKKVFGD